MYMYIRTYSFLSELRDRYRLIDTAVGCHNVALRNSSASSNIAIHNYKLIQFKLIAYCRVDAMQLAHKQPKSSRPADASVALERNTCTCHNYSCIYTCKHRCMTRHVHTERECDSVPHATSRARSRNEQRRCNSGCEKDANPCSRTDIFASSIRQAHMPVRWHCDIDGNIDDLIRKQRH